MMQLIGVVPVLMVLFVAVYVPLRMVQVAGGWRVLTLGLRFMRFFGDYLWAQFKPYLYW